MDRFVIEGGIQLSGEVSVRSAKNAVLPILAASLLGEKGEVILHNVPAIRDIATMLELMGSLGARVHMDGNQSVRIDASNINNFHADYDLVRKMRASFLVTGPLLARMGRAEVSHPGGCSIGARPVNFHVRGFEQLGATVEEKQGYLLFTVGELVGGKVFFDCQSHTGTENVIMAAVLAKGKTEIINASCEPEVTDLCNFLNKMGANIHGAGTPHITIHGVDELHGTEYTPIGDRLEAGTYLYSAMITGGKIKVKGIDPELLNFVLYKMQEMGAEISTSNDSISIEMFGRPSNVDITTAAYPAFPTDLQPMAMAVMAISYGTGYIRERVFENRFSHSMELTRLGANITIDGDRATIKGINDLEGASIMASDIRAGAGLVVAALAAKGTSEILRVYHIDRGYEMIEKKLNSLGAKITRVV